MAQQLTDYMKKHQVHILIHGMTETLLQNQEVPIHDALLTFLRAEPFRQRDTFVLTPEQLQEALPTELPVPKVVSQAVPPVMQAVRENTGDRDYPRTASSEAALGLLLSVAADRGIAVTALQTTYSITEPTAAPTPLLESKKAEWRRIVCNGPGPSARAGHASCTTEDKMWVFGGHHNGTFCNDIFSLQLSNVKWNEITAFPAPRGRAGHSFVTGTDRRLWSFGGADGSQSYFNDLWSFDTASSSWNEEIPTGRPPCERAGHSAVTHDGKMWVFGGESNVFCLNDLHFLDFQTLKWTHVQVSGVVPAPRGGHSCAVHTNSLWIFGGDDRTNYFNDTFVFDISKRIWSRADTTRDALSSARGGHVCTISGGKLIVFGGVSDSQLRYLNDTLSLDLKTLGWAVHKASGEPPSVRSGHTAVTAKGALWVWGGYDDVTFFDSLHCLTLP
eukprot:TRINITY_DN17474_c0_g1_i1.p1 TRINITY_DN17474_c0_g1~~TRINITY_DN17474_c0_g1_i1.p1  ORF type:complete len:445 (-),score=43.60 TRINITY_DN17474_c0_g1_i1:10-1344(-)